MIPRSALAFSPGAAGPLLGEPEPDWRDAAACSAVDPEIFFPEKGGSTANAKRVCFSCPVRAECLDDALARNEAWGIWGGTSERERRRLKHQRAILAPAA